MVATHLRYAMRKKKSLPVYTIKTFQEKTQTLQFEMGTLEDNVKRLAFASTPHRHDCFFIMFITQGNGTHTIDTVEYPVKPYAAYMMSPGQVHGWSFSENVKGYYIYFTLEFYKSYVRERHIEKLPYVRMYNIENYVQFDPQADRGLEALFINMHLEFKKRQMGWDDVLRNCLDILLIQINRCARPDLTIKGRLATVTHIRTLQSLIEKHFLDVKLPSGYAEIMNVTPKYLNALCKGALNKTVTELIHERTLLEAKRYLVYSERSIKQIADELGFNDVSYFMRFFKKLTGSTPDQFRKTISFVKSVEVDDLI